MTHAQTIQAIKKYLKRELAGTVNVTHQGNRISGSDGIPDLYVQIPLLKAAFWFEVKVGRDRLRESQTDFIEREIACGNRVFYGDLDAFKKAVVGFAAVE